MQSSDFLFRNVELFSPEYGELICTPAIVHDQPYHCQYECSGKYGSFTFHEVVTDDFNLCYGHLMANQDTTLFIRAGLPMLGIVFSLGDEADLVFEGLQKCCSQKGEYSLLYVPVIQCMAEMRRDRHYAFLSVALKNENQLARFTQIPSLAWLYARVKKGEAGYAAPAVRTASFEVKAILEAVINLHEHATFQLSRAVAPYFINAKLHELLALILGGPYSPAVHLPDSVVRALDQVHGHLMACLNRDPGTLKDISRMVGMSTTQMTRAFKSVYGAPLMEYLWLKRWEKAGELMAAGMTLSDIAASVGYSSLAHFSNAYRKRYGNAPSKWGKSL